MHLIYVSDTVDEFIYAKTDWSDLTGEAANRYWAWPIGSSEPKRLDGPPRTPKPTEDEAWIAVQTSGFPTEWPGEASGQGVFRQVIRRGAQCVRSTDSEPTECRPVAGSISYVAGLLDASTVTPQHRVVIVWEASGREAKPLAVGRLDEPFRVAAEVSSSKSFDETGLTAGLPARPRPQRRKGGSFRISQRGRRRGRTKDSTWPRVCIAHGRLSAGSECPGRPQMRGMPLNAWHPRFSSTPSVTLGTRLQGQRLYLADVSGGFDWPDESEGRST